MKRSAIEVASRAASASVVDDGDAAHDALHLRHRDGGLHLPRPRRRAHPSATGSRMRVPTTRAPGRTAASSRRSTRTARSPGSRGAGRARRASRGRRPLRPLVTWLRRMDRGFGALGSLPRGPLGRLRRGPRERRWCRKPGEEERKSRRGTPARRRRSAGRPTASSCRAARRSRGRTGREPCRRWRVARRCRRARRWSS